MAIIFHELIKDKLREIIPGTYHEFNYQNPPPFPFAVFTVRYEAGQDEGTYNGDLEIEIVDNAGENRQPMEERTFQVIRALDRALLQNADWYVYCYMKPSGAFTLPALDDQINRKMLQFTLKIDRRFL